MKIQHDFHIHTYLSLCAPDKTGTVENYVQSAKAQGLTKLGFADHFWGSEPGDSEYYNNVRSNPDEYYRIQNFEYILSTRDEIELEIAKRKQEQADDVAAALEEVACAQIIE